MKIPNAKIGTVLTTTFNQVNPKIVTASIIRLSHQKNIAILKLHDDFFIHTYFRVSMKTGYILRIGWSKNDNHIYWKELDPCTDHIIWRNK